MITIDTVGSGGESTLAQAGAHLQPIQDRPAALVDPVTPDRSVKADTYVADSGTRSVEAQFSVDPDTHETVVRVVDASTQEVIRELPPEAIRNLSKTLEHYVGTQMDTKA